MRYLRPNIPDVGEAHEHYLGHVIGEVEYLPGFQALLEKEVIWHALHEHPGANIVEVLPLAQRHAVEAAIEFREVLLLEEDIPDDECPGDPDEFRASRKMMAADRRERLERMQIPPNLVRVILSRGEGLTHEIMVLKAEREAASELFGRGLGYRSIVWN